MPSQKKFKTSKTKLDKMVEEATVDCYGEEEAFSGILVTVGDNLPYPFEAKVIGEPVQVIGFDESKSGLGRGIIVIVRKGGKEYRVALSDLEVSENFKGRQWLELYEYYTGGM